MRVFPIIFLLAIACTRRINNGFSWDKVEKRIDNETKQKILFSVEDDLVKSYHKMASETASLEIYSLFHFLDINNDGLDDIIYNGFGGASNEYLMIFFKTNEGYKKQLHEYGHITDWT